MIKRPIFCAFKMLTAVLMSLTISMAQTPAINTTLYKDLVRFAAQRGSHQEIRVEVFTVSGEKIFDSGFVGAREFDWRMQDQQGKPVADGIYSYISTVRDLSGNDAETESGPIVLERARPGLEEAPQLARQELQISSSSGPIKGGGTIGKIAKWADVDQIGDSGITEKQGRVGIGTTEPNAQLNVAGSRPPASSANGTNATDALTINGGKGGDTTGVSGQTAGAGANVVIRAGDGGDSPAGSASGNGGSITIQPGAAGSGSGSSGAGGNVILAPSAGNVGIGSATPGSKLTVAGQIETTLGGIKFPDGTMQTTAGTGTISGITAGVGLSGGGSNGTVTVGISSGGVQNGMLADGAVTAPKIGPGQVLKSLNGLSDSVTLQAGSNITITPSGNTLTIGASSGLPSVSHGVTLTGDGTSGSPLSIASPLSLVGNGSNPVLSVTNGTGGPAINAAGGINTTGQYSIGGSRVLSVAGFINTFVGVGAGQNNVGAANAFFGNSAGLSNVAGSSNSFYGANAGAANTGGSSNSFFGESAGAGNTTGGSNSFFGRVAGGSNTTGSDNSFFGNWAGRFNTTGVSNSYFGGSAGFSNTTGAGNSFFGSGSGFNNTTGNSNAFFGTLAGQANTSGIANSFFGDSAGGYNTTGLSNSFFGSAAGHSNTIEDENTFIGASSNGAPGITNATAIGALAQVTQSNSVVLGNRANVGIGTTAPKAKLDVEGGDVFVGLPGRGIILKSPDGAICRSLTIDNAGNLVIEAHSCPQ